jgi:hypothetical protein
MAQCIVPGYAEGLSTEQHKLISKKAKEDYGKTPYAGRLLSAKSAIWEKTAAIQARQCKPGEAIPKKRGKLNREAREILQKMPDLAASEPTVETEAIPHGDLYLSDDWINDVPDLAVDNRPFQQSSLNI